MAKRQAESDGRAADEVNDSADLAIVGGGVIGLSIAYVLAREGMRCVVYDQGEMGRQASWAGAGLLPALSERIDSSPLLALRSWSAVLYPEWSAILRESTGIDNGYRRTGGVDVARTDAEEADLRVAAGRWRREGVVFERMPPGDYVRVEPALNPDLRAVYFLPDRAQIRNPRHLKALEASLRASRVELKAGTRIEGFETASGRVSGVRTSEGLQPVGAVVIAAGAWSGPLLAGLGAKLDTAPLKGEIVLLKSDRPLLRRIVEHGRNYLVPRDDGRILVGASEENAGFDTRPTPQAIRELLDEALMLCPGLASAEVERTWAGLRPGSVDTRPYLGHLRDFENLYVATGHKRAGLQLAPATAEVMADLILGRPPRIDLAPFAPDRVASGTESDDPGFRS